MTQSAYSVHEDQVLDDPVEMTQSILIGLRLATKIPTDIRYLLLFVK